MLSRMRPFRRPYLGRMSFATLLSDTPPAYIVTVMSPMMQMEVIEGDDGGRRKEQVVVGGGGEEARQI
jgi:hypothetical protein